MHFLVTNIRLMKQQLSWLQNEFNNQILTIQTLQDLKSLSDEYLGKKWKLNEILKWLKDLSIEEKKDIGMHANELKDIILAALETKQREIEQFIYQEIEKNEAIDVSLEFPSTNRWHLHPISLTSKILEDIFISLGFKIEDGPQIETEEFNFDKLNIPDNHPARDVWDTFWISDKINASRSTGDKYLLRTHTSPVQIRTMLEKLEISKQSWEDIWIKIIVPGRVFRYEQEDARHTSNFYQLEGLVVWKWVTFWDLKWTLDTAMKKLLWEKTKLRFRPSIFPFTEPSAEIDISCQICKGKWWDCRMCSGTGWVELLGAGMVHPKVLQNCWIDPEVYSGFAFGMWIDRIAAQRYWVSSSRMFYQNKLKLNEQF